MKEIVGGVFLLQELVPKRLLGSLVSVTHDTGPGWIHISFFPEEPLFAFQEVGDQASLLLSRNVAMSLIGLFSVLIVQNRMLRGESRERIEAPAAGVDASGLQVHAQGRESFVCSWSAGIDGIKHELEGEQIELRIREDVAEEMLTRLVDQIARIAAGAPRSS